MTDEECGSLEVFTDGVFTDGVTTPGGVGASSTPRKHSKLAYYWRVMRWMWRHREEPNNRAKWRRMAKEIAC
jgi:hypothetical protein